MAVSKKLPQVWYSLLAGLSGVVVGVAIGWNVMAVRTITDEDHMNCTHCQNDVAWRIAGSYCVGTALGGLVQSTLAVVLGYRRTIALCDMAVFIGCLMMARLDQAAGLFGPNTVPVGRLIQGVGAGSLELLTPAYIVQVSDCSVRGPAVVTHHVFLCLGVFLSYCLGYLFDYALFAVICTICPVLHFFGTLLLPDSPCQKYARGHHPDAIKSVIRQFKGPDFNADSEYSAIKTYMKGCGSVGETSADDSQTCSGSKQKLRRRARRIGCIGIGLVIVQHLCGGQGLALHMELGISQYKPSYDGTDVTKYIVIAVSASQVLTSIAAVVLVDCLGRKCLLIASAMGMILSMAALTVHNKCWAAAAVAEIKLADDSGWRTNAVIPVVLVAIYACSYTLGWGPVTELVYAEVIRFDMRCSSVIHAGGMAITLLLAHSLFAVDRVMDRCASGQYIPYVYFGACAMGVAVVCFCVPNTRVNIRRIADVLNDEYWPADSPVFTRDAGHCCAIDDGHDRWSEKNRKIRGINK